MEKRFDYKDEELVLLDDNVVDLNDGETIRGYFAGICEAKFQVLNKDTGELETPTILKLEVAPNEFESIYCSDVLKKKIDQNDISLDDFISIKNDGKKPLKNDPKKSFRNFIVRKLQEA